MIIFNQIEIIEPVFVIIFNYTYQRAASKQEFIHVFLEEIIQITWEFKTSRFRTRVTCP